LRLIEALTKLGFSIPDLARAMEKSSVSLRRTLLRRTVTAQTAAAVSNLYDRLLRDGCFDDRWWTNSSAMNWRRVADH